MDLNRRPDTNQPPQPGSFEHDRLALFSRHGFDAESRWIEHPDGRRTYVAARGAADGKGASPTLLVHGGLSKAGEWALLAGRLAERAAGRLPDASSSSPADHLPEPPPERPRAHDVWIRMPDARLRVVSGAGHLPYLEDPDTVDSVAESIADFLGGADPL